MDDSRHVAFALGFVEMGQRSVRQRTKRFETWTDEHVGIVGQWLALRMVMATSEGEQHDIATLGAAVWKNFPRDVVIKHVPREQSDIWKWAVANDWIAHPALTAVERQWSDPCTKSLPVAAASESVTTVESTEVPKEYVAPKPQSPQSTRAVATSSGWSPPRKRPPVHRDIPTAKRLQSILGRSQT